MRLAARSPVIAGALPAPGRKCRKECDRQYVAHGTSPQRSRAEVHRASYNDPAAHDDQAVPQQFGLNGLLWAAVARATVAWPAKMSGLGMRRFRW